MALKRNGASTGSVVAFLLGNPTLNPAVLIWILLALGWQWGLLRLVVGLALVIGAAALTTRLNPAVVSPTLTEELPLEPAADSSLVRRWLRSFVRLVVMLVPIFAILVLVMGAARAFLFPAIEADWGNNWQVIVGFALAGMLFPIPTGAEIPIIQAMMASGLGAGPAAALLLTLAPVSLPSLAMMSHALPVRVVASLAGLTVTAGLVGAGLAVISSL